MKTRLFRQLSIDGRYLLFLFFISLIFRFPYISEPPVTVFDEVIYKNYVVALNEGRPFIDVHPPLARILFAEVGKSAEQLDTTISKDEPGRPFGNFPYIPLRTFVSIFGIALPLIIYCIARALGTTAPFALFVGLLLSTDNSLIIYSRLILPDTLLLFFEFLAFLLALLSMRKESRRDSAFLVFLSSFSIGCALSIKWTALGMFSLIALLFISSKRKFSVIPSILIAFAVYITIFTISLVAVTPMGGVAENLLSERFSAWSPNIEFPYVGEVLPVLAFLPELHKAMLAINFNTVIAENALIAPSPLLWPIAGARMALWRSGDGSHVIILSGNTYAWSLSFFLFIFDVLWIAREIIRSRKIPVSKNEALILVGYVANYLPFFFIHRQMYLYHYFTALVFLFLLIPFVLPRIMCIIKQKSGAQLSYKAGVIVLAIFIIVNFLLVAKTTYGL